MYSNDLSRDSPCILIVAWSQAERRSRASVAFKITENIAQEREDLVKELDLLRSINAKMLDEKDSNTNAATNVTTTKTTIEAIAATANTHQPTSSVAVGNFWLHYVNIPLHSASEHLIGLIFRAKNNIVRY